jgi:hypothetical protein
MKPFFCIILYLISIHSIFSQTFQDDLVGEVQGDFPSQWDLTKGSAEIASLEGVPYIYFSNGAIITPKIDGEDYLSANFTLEFDAYFDATSKIVYQQYFEVRFWKGNSYLSLDNNRGFMNPLTIYCYGSKMDGRVDGPKVKYDGYLQSMKDPLDVWRHIVVKFNNGHLRILIDDFQSINIPKLEFTPKMISIGTHSASNKDYVRGIKNIRITGIDSANGSSGDVNTGNNSGNSDTTNTNPDGEDLTISYNYKFPIEDGEPNQILQTDGNGTVSWVDDNPIANDTITSTNSEGLKIDDLLDGKSDPDGSSVFLGLNAGNSDDGTSNKNVGIGFESLKNNTGGNGNTALGTETLNKNTMGWSNTANGFQALTNNTTGFENVAIGYRSLNNNTIGNNNIANGFYALYSNTEGNRNIAIGSNALNKNITGNENIANGYRALFNNTTGSNNIAIGSQAGYNNIDGIANIANGYRALFSNTAGSNNIATGYQTLYSNTIGNENTANGVEALYSNTTGNENTAVGYRALYNNTGGNRNTASGVFTLENNSGNNNTATGYQALNKNTTGEGNTANGSHALKYNTTGKENTATGSKSLYSNTEGRANTANGLEALHKNTTGNYNTAIGMWTLKDNVSGFRNTALGFAALSSNTTGKLNTAIGNAALSYNTTGSNNIAIGRLASTNNTTGNDNIAIGEESLNSNKEGYRNVAIGPKALNHTKGNKNTAIGYYALSNSKGSNNIGVGDFAQVPNGNGSNQVSIGNEEITYAGIQVAWTVTSDQLWKEDIRPLPVGLEFVKQLKPVDYIRINNENKTREMGFIAQDVEQTLLKSGYKDQGFLTEDDEGRLSLRYNDLIPLLTKAIQDQQIIIEDLKKRIESLERNYEETKND